MQNYTHGKSVSEKGDNSNKKIHCPTFGHEYFDILKGYFSNFMTDLCSKIWVKEIAMCKLYILLKNPAF